MKQGSFDFPDEPKGTPKAEPPRPAQVTPQGTSICHYCGERMPAAKPSWALRSTRRRAHRCVTVSSLARSRWRSRRRGTWEQP